LKIHKIPSTTKILDLVAMPVFFEGENDTGILMLHGFTGTPCELYQLGEKLNKSGFTVSIPRLPGHGTNAKDFLQTGWRDWLRRAFDSYIELKYRCKIVNIVGLSMGALLGIIIAANFEVPKLVLAAPALKVNDRRLGLTPLFSFAGYLPKNSILPEYEYDGLNKIADEYWNKLWIKPAADFYKIQRLAKRELKKIESEIFAIFSKNDRTVPISTKEILESNIPQERLKILILEKSSHVVTSDVEKEIVAQNILKWMNS